jgi:hypothetical protein
MSKLAFLFLIYDEINHEDMWFRFFENVDKSKYNIYIHFKNSVPLKHFEKYKLDDCIPTNYGEISLVYAQRLLLKKALNDEENHKFIFVSNSCIPLKSFDYVYNKLMVDNNVHFDIARRESSFPRCNHLAMYMDKKDVYKSSQWCILNREASLICLEDITIVYYFKNVFAPEEYYFISMCKKMKNVGINNEATTFVNWDETDDEDGCSPKTYYSITEEEYRNLQNSYYLFARKFSKDCYIKSKMI